MTKAEIRRQWAQRCEEANKFLETVPDWLKPVVRQWQKDKVNGHKLFYKNIVEFADHLKRVIAKMTPEELEAEKALDRYGFEHQPMITDLIVQHGSLVRVKQEMESLYG